MLNLILTIAATVLATGQAASPKPREPRPGGPIVGITATPAPTPIPVRAGEVAGVVLLPDGKPAAKARVGLLVPTQSGDLPETPLVTTTDEDGAFRFDFKGKRSFTLQAHLAPFSFVSMPRVTGGRRVTLRLEVGGRLDGMVLDAANGQPLPNASIEGSEWEVSPYIDVDRDFGMTRATSDAKGRFTLPGLSVSGRWVARARSRGFATAVVTSAAPSGLRFRLEPGRDLVGTIKDTAGQPVAKATLLLRPTIRRGSEAATAVTNATGRFEVPGLRNVPYDISITATGFAPYVKDALAADLTTLNVVLEKTARVTGRFVDENGKPLRGRARVRSWQGEMTPPEADRLVATESGADGTFTLSGLRPGSNLVDLQAAGFPRQERKVEIAKGGETVAIGDVRFERGLSIHGRAATKEDLPVSGARVQATKVTRGAGPPEALLTQTGDDGSFDLRGLDAESYQLTITADGFARQSVKAAPSDDNVSVLMRPTIRAAGRLVDSTGQPVGRARVSAQKGNDQASSMSSVSGSDGRFTLDLPDTGATQLNVIAEGFTPLSRSISVEGEMDLGDLVLSRGLKLRGSVVDGKGSAVVGARIENQSTRQFPVTFAETDDKGLFEITGVTLGRVRLVATHSQYSPGQTYVEVKEGEEPEEARIAMGAGGRIEGVVRNRDNSPVGQAVVQLFGGSSNDNSRPPSGFTATLTQADGSFVFDHVYPGSMNVLLMTGQQGSYTNVDQVAATAIEGQTTSVSLTLKSTTVRGSLRRKDGPVSGLRVSIVGGFVMMTGSQDRIASLVGEIPWRSAVADADGRFALRVAGPVKGRVAVSDGTSTLLSKEVEIPDADEFQLPLDLAGSRVSGRVTDAEGKGIREAQITATRKASGTGASSGFWSARTDASGSFAFEFEPGEYQLTAMADGYAGSAPIPAKVGTTDLSLGDITLSRGGSVSGRVTLAGLPVSQARVDAESRATEAVQTRYTGPDGYFTITGLPDGPVRIVAADQNGHAGILVAEAASTEPIEVKLAPAARIEVTVIGPREVLGMTDVSITKLDGYVHRQWSRADATGRSVLFSPAGTVTIGAAADKLAGEATIQVEAGQTTSVTITLTPKTEDASARR